MVLMQAMVVILKLKKSGVLPAFINTFEVIAMAQSKLVPINTVPAAFLIHLDTI